MQKRITVYEEQNQNGWRREKLKAVETELYIKRINELIALAKDRFANSK
jgi:uncharacterized protein YnzC (UPF0291/DUF896 family)